MEVLLLHDNRERFNEQTADCEVVFMHFSWRSMVQESVDVINGNIDVRPFESVLESC